MKETSLVEKLMENTPLAILVTGVLLFVIRAAGGWPTPPLRVHESGWRIALAVMGVIMAGLGGLSFWRERTRGKKLRRKNSAKDRRRFTRNLRLKITSPSDEGTVGENFTVEGKYEVKPPDGVAVVVLEVSPKSGLYYPKSKAVFFDGKRKTWKTASISIASRQYRGGERKLGCRRS